MDAPAAAPCREPANPWPARLPLGPRALGPFAPCANCGDGTWARYGDTPLCLACARGCA
jgi:hypothetical protein